MPMLVVSMNYGEKVVLRSSNGEEIRIWQFRTKKGRRQMAIEAPAEVQIRREKNRPLESPQEDNNRG